MAKHYKDYGSLVGFDRYTVHNIRLLIDYEQQGEVYRLTHDGEGKSLFFMNKAFISFTYGGKKIEDFGLIATSIDNRYNGLSPPAHEDFVTDSRMLNGQYYWGSHYNAREMTISLATDGITQMQLDKFKYWFQAGEIKELIMALHPNRGILARIADAPHMSLVPFKRKKYTTINNRLIETIVTEYKGTIELNFVMDDPFWYAIHNVLGATTQNSSGQTIIVDRWTNANGEIIDLLDDDAYKVAVEDHIPTSGMINSILNFADNLQLQLYNPYKYTLTNVSIEEEIPNDFEGLTGTPLVNKVITIGNTVIEDNIYPLSGAVVGPLYLTSFYLNETITLIKEDWILQNAQFDDKGNISLVIELISGRNQYFIVQQYLPVKSGIISYNTAKNNGNLKIIFYSKLNQSYIKTNTTNINNNNISYSFDLPSYIRLLLSIPTTYLLLNTIINFNDFISVSLLTFSTIIIGSEFTKNDTLSYFYSGTAPSYPNISFSVPLSFDDKGYINTFSNVYSKHLNNNIYNTFTLLSEFNHELKITNPSIFNSYNKVIQKLHTTDNENVVELIQWFRNEIGHYAVRNWIINCINIYYNNNLNLDNQLNKIIIGRLGKQQLLQYMPYLFASVEEALITKKDEGNIPEVIRSEEQFLGSLLFGSNYKRLNIEQNNQTGIYLVRAYENRSLLITVKASNNNALFYLWQYSHDGNAWFEMLSPWYDDDTATLKCDSLILDWDGKFLKCVVSNNVDTIGDESTDPILKIIIITDDLTITRVGAETITLNQNSTTNRNTKIAWNINGSYYSDIDNNNVDYSPRLYYKEPGDNKKWMRWISEFNTEELEDSNQSNDFIFRRQLDPRIINTNIIKSPLLIKLQLNKIYLSFTPSENSNKMLRGTQFKIRLYKISTEVTLESLLEDQGNYVDSLPITIQIKRIEFNNETHISLNIKRNNIDINSYENFPESLECFINTLFNIAVTGIINRTENTKCYMQIGTKDIASSEIFWSAQNIMTLSYNSSANNFIGTWTYTQRMENSYGNNIYLRFYLQDYSLNMFIVTEQNTFHIILKDEASAAASINNWINLYKSRANYMMENTNLQLYEGDIATLYVQLDSNNFPTAILNKYIITYLWQFSTTRDGTFRALTNGTVTYTNTNKVWSYLLQDNTLNAGFYRAVVTLQFYNIADNNYIDIPDVSPTDIILVQVIPTISFGSLSCNMQNWKYYSKEASGEKWSDSNNNKQVITSNSNLNFTISCEVQNCSNYTSYKVVRVKGNVSDLFAMNESYVSLILNSNNKYIMSFNIPLTCDNLQAIYNNNNNATFYFVINDYYNTEISSDTFTIQFDNTKDRRLVLITPNFVDINDSWTTGMLLYGKKAAYMASNTVVGVFSACPLRYSINYSCSGSWKNNKYTFSGVPRTKTTATKASDPIETKNIGAARSDWAISTNTPTNTFPVGNTAVTQSLKLYIKFVTQTVKSWQSFYNGYNAEFNDLLTIPYNQFSSLSRIVIKFSNLTFPQLCKYEYKIRVIQGNSILVQLTDITTLITILEFVKTAQAQDIKVQILIYDPGPRKLPTELKNFIYTSIGYYDKGILLDDIQKEIDQQIENYTLTISFQLNSIIGYF